MILEAVSINLCHSLPQDGGQGAGAGVWGMVLRLCPLCGTMSLDSQWPAGLNSSLPLFTSPQKGARKVTATPNISLHDGSLQILRKRAIWPTV